MFEIVWKYKKAVYLYIIKQQQNIKKMENYTITQKANYIVKMIKSVNKSLDYAVETAAWYSMTDSEQLEIENEIKMLWNN